MNKRILSLFLALTLLCGLLPQMGLTAHADTYSGTCGAEGDGSNLQWSFDDDTGVLTITGSGEMADFDRSQDVPWYAYRGTITAVNLPDGLTSIGWPAFSGCSALTSVTIPDSVTSIGDYAFEDCSSLTSVTIGNGVTSIGYRAFEDCSALTSVTIGNSVTSIGSEAFSGCSSLTSVAIPDSVTSIGDRAFADCSALTSVTIPDSVTSIGDSAFKNCSALTSVTIPDSVTSIGFVAFSECSALTAFVVASANPNYSSKDGVLFNKSQTELIQYPAAKSENSYTIPNSVTSIDYAAFFNCSVLTSVTIPDSVTSIGYAAFSGCSSLTSVTIGNGVTSIGDFAFYGCSSLTSVTIGNGVTNIGEAVFYNCTALTSVTIPASVTSIGEAVFANCSALTSVTIPDSVTSIGYHAFYSTAYYNDETNWTDHILYLGNWVLEAKREITTADIRPGTRGIADGAFFSCSALASVTIPDSVTDISNGAFEACSALTSVTIPDSVTDISSWAFADCSALTSVTIGNGVTSIGNCAFYGCSSLTSVTIPDSVTRIGWHAFSGTAYYNDETNWTDQILYLSNWVLAAKEEITAADIRQGTRGIADRAFCDCSALTSVTIGDGVTSIGEQAFEDCSALTSVTIPVSVTSIGYAAFYGCSALTSVTIGNGVTSIGDYAFYNCSALTSVTIPDSVTSIGDHAFGYYWNRDTYEKERLAGFTIYGYEGTEAQRYAEANEFKFVSLQVVNPFEDVTESDFYFNPVLWAVENEVTSGRDATHFAPHETVKRSEAMLFFYAAKGRPAFKTTTSPFKDVKKKHWFYDAVLWAVENKITSGTDATHFSPNKTCIRSEILQFLYAAMDKPKYSIENPYSDVKKKHWYYDGAIWAYEKGLEKGSNGKFKAKTPCTRAYVVTYLYRFITGKELVK